MNRDRRAFTLVEVLLATFIIALGVLGLLALFAGAARQQQTATQVTSAAILARNAEAVIANNLGKLVFPPGGLAALPGWNPVAMHEQYHYLSINPNCSSTAPYFLADPFGPVPHVLYEWQEQQGMTLTPQLFGIPGFQGGSPGDFGTYLVDIGQRRIDPDSVRLQVQVVYDPPPGGPGVYQALEPQEYFRIPGETYTSDSGSIFVFPLGGDPAMENTDYIRLNCQFGCDGTDAASMYAINIPQAAETDPGPFHHISKVTLVTFRWRNDQFVSLGDRILTRLDDTAEAGVVPDITYSLLYRSAGNQTQMVVFTYQLTPPSSSAEYVPPEAIRFVDPTGTDARRRPPLRLAELKLRYDLDQKLYYVTLEDEENLWAIEPGQVLLVARRLNVLNDPGADAPVTVVRRVRHVQGANVEWRGYLSDSPRAENSSLLTVDQRQNGDSVDIDVYGVNDVVRSVADDSLWRLKPLEAFLFQVTQN